MGNNLMVVAPEPKDFIVTLEQFKEASSHWQPHGHFSEGPITDDGESDATIEVDRPGEPSFLIIHFRDEVALYIDGTEDQAADVAAWAINTFPRTGPGEVWLLDQGYSGHTVLRPGMSAADVLKDWQEHD